MSRWLPLLAVPMVVAGCATAAGRPEAIRIHRELPSSAIASVPLRNAGFESPARTPNHCADRWDCTVHADPSSFAFTVGGREPPEGKQALCIDRVGKEPWATVTQGVHDAGLAGKKLRLSMLMRLAGTTGDGAGPWVVLHGTGGRMLKHDQKLVKSTDGWQRTSIDIDVLPGTEIVEIGATLEGPGSACIDDVRLEVIEARAASAR